MTHSYFHKFSNSTAQIPLPQRFTFPFHYEPHILARMAATQLQEYITLQSWFNDDASGEQELGKMFGVLVVINAQQELGFLAAFSGKLANSNHHAGFVPPIYDMLDEQGVFLQESRKLERINEEINALVQDICFCESVKKTTQLQLENNNLLETQRTKIKYERAARKQLRNDLQAKITPQEFTALQEKHNQQRINDRFLLREYEIYLNDKLAQQKVIVNSFEQKINTLKEARKTKSNEVQDYLFEQYNFLNSHGVAKNVIPIFEEFSNSIPPAGAGDCAAPKLLQFAFENDLKPITMAEFWWGKPAPSMVRKQGNFYPACRSKCEPILGHMLQGMELYPNPLLENPALGKQLEIIYEDAYLVIINKPAEFLSVPGKTITDSVQERMRVAYPNATGPLTVHRLDMSTSGLMVIALDKDVHAHLQEQFMSRKVKKQYTALLDGIIKEDSGFIDLPLRVDLDHRPYQLVCHEHGKNARTTYEVVSRDHGKTRIHFYPITGRTHQLRVHAAHKDGLNAAIVGDDLYGIKKDRLHLHASFLSFKHPITKELLTFASQAHF